MNNISNSEESHSYYLAEVITVPRKRLDRSSLLNVAEEPTLRSSFFENDRRSRGTT